MSSELLPRPCSAASYHSVIHNRHIHANLLGIDGTDSERPTRPFQRWVSTLRRRKRQQTVPPVTSRSERWCLDDFDETPLRQHDSHARSDSAASSLGIIAGVKSATVTLASVSIAPLSRRASKWRRHSSSMISDSDPRPSVDTQRSVLDEAGKSRSRKRREKLEELIRTEESYVADLKALSNVCIPQSAHYVPTNERARPTLPCLATTIPRLRYDSLVLLLKRPLPKCCTFTTSCLDSFTASCLSQSTISSWQKPQADRKNLCIPDGIVWILCLGIPVSHRRSAVC